jgi:tetratricopeptide (TPR) repeat protein
MMQALAWTYGLMGRLEESLALYKKFFALRNAGFGRNTTLLQYVIVCQWAGKYDQAEQPLRDALKLRHPDPGSHDERNETANLLGFLALNLLLQGRYDEAEPIAREAVAMNRTTDFKYPYWVSIWGTVLLSKGKYAEAEPLLLKGYEGMTQVEGFFPEQKRRTAEVVGWIVHLYEATDQPEKARAWREKVSRDSRPGPK